MVDSQSASIFKITQRQYEIIIRQTLENLPCESGGFLGGSDDCIKGVLPVYNQNIGDSTSTFAISTEDIDRAHRFFEKHQLEYYGVYHSHPKGIPEPSTQDLRNIQRYLFIIGLKNPKDPIFNAFRTTGYHAQRVPIQVIDNKGFTVLDLKENQSKASESPFLEEARRLENFYQDILHERMKYQKLDPVIPFDNSEFSTIA